MDREQAEMVAIQALAWLADQNDLMAQFLGQSGADVKQLKHAAADPAFLGAVLDFILSGDPLVRRFCDFTGLACDTPAIARQALAGGETMNWT